MNKVINWRNVLMLTITLLIVGGALAITIGQSFSQAQFNSHDFVCEDFDLKFDSAKIVNSNGHKFGVVYYSYKTLDWNDSLNEWVVGMQIKPFEINLAQYYNCRLDGDSMSVCKTKLKSHIKKKRNAFCSGLSSYYENLKTDFLNELTENDFNAD